MTAATEAIKLCERKGSKSKGGGGGNKTPAEPAAAPAPAPEVEVTPDMESGSLNRTIEDISAEGVAKGLSGADLVRYALQQMSAGAAVIQAEKANQGKSSDVATGYRTHNCAELRTSNVGQRVALVGWVSKSRVVGQMLAFVDLRDRYGITQCVFTNTEGDAKANALFDVAAGLGREYCVRVEGVCREREAKNPGMPTGYVGVRCACIEIAACAVPCTPTWIVRRFMCTVSLRLLWRKPRCSPSPRPRRSSSLTTPAAPRTCA